MNKRFIKLFVLLIIQSNLANAEDRIPGIVDLRKLTPTCSNVDAELYKLGALSFNASPEIATFVAYLKRQYNIENVIETGTFKGNTTVAFALLFKNVYSIELNEQSYNAAKNSISNFKNINLIKGSSEKVLLEVLPKLRGKTVLFYLDAHWNKYWPILDELEAIGKTHKDNCIIMIDDVQVPGHNELPYDVYKGQALSYDYIKGKLEQVFSNHSVHYIIPRNGNSRAKMVLIPLK